MNANWMDYNDADPQTSFDLIPKGSIVPVRMIIKPGGYDDPSRGLTGGYATHKPETGTVYLSCEFVITEGQYARRKVWSLIGLSSQKGPEWGNMGRTFIRGILNSSRGFSDKDSSPQATQARRINGFIDLDGIEFLAKIEMEKDRYDEDKNVIKFAVTPDQKEYQGYKKGAASPPQNSHNQPPQRQPPPQQQQTYGGGHPTSQQANQQTAQSAAPQQKPNQPTWAQ